MFNYFRSCQIQEKNSLCLPESTRTSATSTWLGRTVRYLKELVTGIHLTIINFIKTYFMKGAQTPHEPLHSNTLHPTKHLLLEAIKPAPTEKSREKSKTCPAKTEDVSSCPEKEDSHLEEFSPKKATYHLLTTPGFVKEFIDKKTTYGYKGEVQGSKALRLIAAKVTGCFPQAITPSALKEQRHLNLEQYLTFKLKRFGHAFSLKGWVTLPSGKEINLEGFCEAFTIPMIASSFEEFARKSPFFQTTEKNWIVQQLNQTTTSDYLEKEDIQKLTSRLQQPDFIGPISMGTGYNWHSTATIFFGNQVLFCNRGAGSEKDHGIHIYALSDRTGITEEIVWKLAKRQENKASDAPSKELIAALLDGKPVHYEAMPFQQAGNCTYLTMEAALFALMAINLLKDVPQAQLNAVHWQQAFKSVNQAYQHWWDFDRELILQDMIKEIQEWQEQREPRTEDDNLWVTYREILNYWNRYHGKDQPIPLPIKNLLKYFGILQ